MWAWAIKLFGGFSLPDFMKSWKFWAGVLLCVILWYGQYQYHKMNETIQTQIQTITQLQNDLKTTKENLASKEKEVSTIRADINTMVEANMALEKKNSAYRKQLDELITKFTKHDLSKLANAKPTMVEKIINKASADRLRCFELATGANKKEGEKNEVCKNLFIQ